MPEENDNVPLIKKNLAGAGLVAIPLAAIISAFGWVGAKVLEIDERQQGHDAVIRELKEDQDEWVAVALKAQERITRLEDAVGVLREEQLNIRKREGTIFYKLQRTD